MTCWLCDLEFEPEEEDWHDSCDIIEGQLVVRQAVECLIVELITLMYEVVNV